eukprot:TRINITY_DN19230_c0_g1_i1.p1 TRINITY_DN19230_c0_g1~~TRINITY_DN19230_c0_g1_i1.p1  ORF type:complete len:585 (-),score=60.42 TRINITY_DN19230_c0_g1_i1:309-1808(-)
MALLSFTGMVLLMQGESCKGEHIISLTLSLRLLAWVCWLVIPTLLWIHKLPAYLFHGLTPGGSDLSQLCRPDFGCETRQQALDAGYEEVQAQRLMLWPVVVTVSTVLVLVVTIYVDFGHQYIGMVPLTVVAGVLARGLSFLAMARLVAVDAERKTYVLVMVRLMLLSLSGFMLSVVGFASAFIFLGDNTLISIGLTCWLGCYEFVGVMLVEALYVKFCIYDNNVRQHPRNRCRGLIPSMWLAVLHNNAECARLAVVQTSVDRGAAVYTVIAGVLGALLLNLSVRTHWALKAVSHMSGGRVSNSNAVQALLRIKFHFGYPRFAVVVAILLARTTTGRMTLQHGLEQLWPCGVLFLAEVLEDATVLLMQRWRLCADVPFPPDLTDERVAETQLQSQNSLKSHRCCACCGCCRRKTELQLSGIVVEPPSIETIVQAHSFRYSSNGFGTMPQWAHCVSTTIPLLHLLLCLVYFGNGVPGLLGLPAYAGGPENQGLLWWPKRDC